MHMQHTPRKAYIRAVFAISYLYYALINVFIVVKSPSHITFRIYQSAWARSTEKVSFPGAVQESLEAWRLSEMLYQRPSPAHGAAGVRGLPSRILPGGREEPRHT